MSRKQSDLSLGNLLWDLRGNTVTDRAINLTLEASVKLVYECFFLPERCEVSLTGNRAGIR